MRLLPKKEVDDHFTRERERQNKILRELQEEIEKKRAELNKLNLDILNIKKT
jgi:hypothetical protein